MDTLSRQVAIDLLMRLDDKNTNTHGLFDRLMRRTDLSDMDQMFVRAMVLGTLRHLGQIDFVLRQLMPRPLPDKLRFVQWVLRLGVAQILYLDVPMHAAVDSTVELVKGFKKGAFTKLVNGVLRSLTRRMDEFRGVSAVFNLPMWFKRLLEKNYGAEVTKQFADLFLVEPPVDLTVQKNPQKWADILGGQVLITHSVRLTNVGRITNLAGFETGDWWVQNAAASVPAQLFSDLRGKRVADLCAAPGGKTAQLALAGAKVDAFDVSEFRLSRLRENMTRLGFAVNTRAADVLTLPSDPVYDAVLLDAPCSATGTIARHPEILYRLKKTDIERLSSLQKQLLNQAVLMTKPGGQIVFSTCSLLPDEGEKIMQWALKKYPFLKRGIVPAHLRELTDSVGDIRLTPIHGMDGFFAGVLIKTA